MSKSKPNNNDKERSDSSIFFIMDGIIDQLNKTKKLFIIMLLTIMIIPPIAFMLSFMLFGFPFHDDSHNGGNGWWWNDRGREDDRNIGIDANRDDQSGSSGVGSGNINGSEEIFEEIPSNIKPWEEGSNSNPSFRYLPLIPVIVVLVWLGIGIRQWFVLSKWDKKYKKYKEMQKKIDEKLDKEDDNKT
ncbi:hypothetical protein [Candidatus Nitrosocosmicus hydrocola]|uniref:hypothetical protein n=1 Tax=Candidatus Nitrosocosmicus hydrocola TaxID=1826872 RepID=UPI0011E5A2E9|nr:hypothetical protein [Candidatus Nitrosocosmicus hydrocola]